MEKKNEFKELTVEDLKNRLTEVSEELVQARRKHRTGQFKKISEFPRLRREVARIKTHLHLRELDEQGAKTEHERATQIEKKRA